MAKQPKVLVKKRVKENGSFKAWEVLADLTHLGEGAVDRGIEQCDQFQKAYGDETEHGVFVGSALEYWLTSKGPKKSKSSVRSQSTPSEEGELFEHRHFFVKDCEGTLVSEIVARDQDTAMRILDQHVFEWDLTKIKIEEGGLAVKGKFNRIVYLNQSLAVTVLGGHA